MLSGIWAPLVRASTKANVANDTSVERIITVLRVRYEDVWNPWTRPRSSGEVWCNRKGVALDLGKRCT
jgi:hypothetical protein